MTKEKLDTQPISDIMSEAIEKLRGVKHELKTNNLIDVYEEPHYRKMRVESGWLYNFWNFPLDNYNTEWTFVPDSISKK